MKHKDKPKILMLGNSRLVIFGFRGELINELVNRGYEVYVSFPSGPFGEGEKESKKFKCNYVDTPIDRRGINPLSDIFLMIRYYFIMKTIKPNCVLAYTVKSDIYGGIACRLTDTVFFPNITGLGKGLTTGGIITMITKFLYKIALKDAECVFFQNEGDRDFFVKNNIKYKTDSMLPGSGVNISHFTPLPYPSSNNVVFLYIARVMKAKGIDHFLEAAMYLKNKYDNINFHVCGYCEEDYKDLLSSLSEKGIIKYYGLVKDIKDKLLEAHCVVLPTFHPEGISNVLLEGAASARPLIATNRSGCKEVIDDGITGFLIEERSTMDLIKKMEKFIEMPNEERALMGLKGREKVQEEFDRQIVVRKYMEWIEKSTRKKGV